MIRRTRLAVLAALALSALAGCTAWQQLAALRTVTFAFSRVSDVRLAGIPLDRVTDFGSLGVADMARLAAAVATKRVPKPTIETPLGPIRYPVPVTIRRTVAGS